MDIFSLAGEPKCCFDRKGMKLKGFCHSVQVFKSKYFSEVKWYAVLAIFLV